MHYVSNTKVLNPAYLYFFFYKPLDAPYAPPLYGIPYDLHKHKKKERIRGYLISLCKRMRRNRRSELESNFS